MTTDLFVYGTLRRACGHPAHAVIARGARFLGEGVIDAALYDVGDYPAAALPAAPGATVRGELYRMHDVRGVLDALDEYEGCSDASPLPHEYQRRVLPVRGDAGQYWQAWVYLYVADVGALPRIASGDYLEYLEAG